MNINLFLALVHGVKVTFVVIVSKGLPEIINYKWP